MNKTFWVVIMIFLTYRLASASGAVWEQGGTKCMPNFKNNKPVGYLCVKVEPSSIYQKTGLQKGDNVIEINGQSVVSAFFGRGGSDRVIDMWKDFEKFDGPTLVVQRADVTLTLKKPAHTR